MSSAAPARAQEPGAFVSAVLKGVALDPTTYAPTVVAWGATRLDWQSSQTFFQHGWAEQNPRFTVSGFTGDTPISYGQGNHQIMMDGFVNLRFSAVHNLSERAVERLLVSKYPDHRTLLRVIGWIERTAMASYWTYRRSAVHFRQWTTNGREAERLGYK